MKGKQLLYTIVSVVFFGAAAVMIYVNFLAPDNQATPPPLAASLPGGPAPGSPTGAAAPVTPKALLPYGTEMNFNVINTYNSGLIQPFQYELVSPEQIGVIDHNQLVKPEGG